MNSRDERGWSWSSCFGIGCASVLLGILIIGAVVVSSVRREIAKMFNPSPIVRVKPYHFQCESTAMKVSLVLPDQYGTLVYMADLTTDLGPDASKERAIMLITSTGKTTEWPLPGFNARNTRVGLYWYSAASGYGPFLEFYDKEGRSFLDLKTQEVGEMLFENHQAFFSYYTYNDNSFSSGMSYESDNGRLTKVTGADGKPARDLTAVFAASKKTYLGSIILSGRKMVFHPVKTAKKP